MLYGNTLFMEHYILCFRCLQYPNEIYKYTNEIKIPLFKRVGYVVEYIGSDHMKDFIRRGRTMETTKKGLLFILMSFVLFFGFSVSARAEEADERPDYVIYVNRTQNCVTVMEPQEDGTSTVVKVMACSCGKVGHATPQGTYRTSDYYEWCYMVDGTYGRYAIRFNKGIMFHSVPYIKKSPDTLEWDQYNLLGENTSLGCVRLAVQDVKWIYDNCKPGTQVTVYSGDEIVGDVTRPDTIQIPEDSPNRGWDPTDFTTPGNPWFASADGLNAETFDYIAYADRYADVKKAFGYDRAALYNHYITYGIIENRKAEFGPSFADFDYIAYADRYRDVKEAFGYNKVALYKHYVTYGVGERRVAESK